MKSIHYIIIALFTLLLSSCDKISDNGDIDGMWQVMTVTSDNSVRDVKAEKLYWSFQLKLVQYTCTRSNVSGWDYQRMYSHFSHDGEELYLYDFCTNSSNFTASDTNEWVSINKASIFYPWGIFAEEDAAHPERICTRFRVEKLNSKEMILQSTNSRIVLRKF